MSVKMVDRDFKNFLLGKYDITYNSWLSIVEPFKTDIYNAYLSWLTDGTVNCSILSFAEHSKLDNDKTKAFQAWLNRCSKVSYDSFLGLPLPTKIKIYNAYCKDKEMKP